MSSTSLMSGLGQDIHFRTTRECFGPSRPVAQGEEGGAFGIEPVEPRICGELGVEDEVLRRLAVLALPEIDVANIDIGDGLRTGIAPEGTLLIESAPQRSPKAARRSRQPAAVGLAHRRRALLPP
jgi:hypothetical protein